MSSPLQNPAVVAVLAVVAGSATGLGWFWRAAEKVAAAHVPVAAPVVAPEKEKGWDFWTIEIDNLTSELKGEKERLKKAMEQVDQRTARLTAEQRELDRVRSELEQMRKQISQQVIEIQADEAKNLRQLAATYSALTPRAAVAILRELDDTTVVKILSLMKPDIVSPIFEEMSRTSDGSNGTLAKRAAVLSEKIRVMRATKPNSPS